MRHVKASRGVLRLHCDMHNVVETCNPRHSVPLLHFPSTKVRRRIALDILLCRTAFRISVDEKLQQLLRQNIYYFIIV